LKFLHTHYPEVRETMQFISGEMFVGRVVALVKPARIPEGSIEK